MGLELAQQPAADPEPARGLGDPHALDLGPSGAAEPQAPTADRAPVQGGEQHDTGRSPDLLLGDGGAPRGIEAGPEPAVQLGEVGVPARLRPRVGGIHRGDLDHRRGHEPLDVGHRPDQAGPLARAQRCEQRGGEVVAAPVEDRSLRDPGRGQTCGPDPPVGLVRADGDHPRLLQGAQQPAEVSGVESEPGAQRAQVAPLGADLPQQPRLAEGTVPGEVAVVQRPHALGDDPVEPAHLCDHRPIHSLTLVRESAHVNPGGRRSGAARFPRHPTDRLTSRRTRSGC